MILQTFTHFFPLVIGFFTLFIGIAATFSPERMSKNFGIVVKGEALPYVTSTGIRDVFIGLIVLLLFYFGLSKALGLCHLFIGIVAISDFLVVRKYGNKKMSFIHLGGALIVIAYGSWLLNSIS